MISLHSHVNQIENNSGFPGARTVIALGIRMTGIEDDWFNNGHLENILSRMNRGDINSEQAVHEAFYAQSTYGFTSQLQANFAFTKAYLVDSAGSKAGFAVLIYLST